MKKSHYFTIVFILVTMIISTSSFGQNANSNKITKKHLTGTWRITDIQTEGFPADYQIRNAFGMVSYENFINSTWILHSSYKGTITLAEGIKQDIYWDIPKDSASPVFQFKKVPAGEKARNIREGYRLEISAVDANSLTLLSPITLDNGSTAYIIYNFSRGNQ